LDGLNFIEKVVSMALELKILFLTDDQDFLSVLENVESDADVILADDADEMLQMLDTLKKQKDELCLIFLDFDTHKDASESICKKFSSVNHLKTIIFTGEVPLSELKKHQRSGNGAHAYLRKPLTVDQLQDIIHTTQVAHELENGRDEPTEDDLCIFKLSEDALFDQAPADAETDDSQSFSASELKMDTEVRKTLSSHGDFVFDHDEEVNQRVQKLFDMAFDGAFERDIKAHKNLNPTDGFELLDDESEDIALDKFDNNDEEEVDSPTIAFDLGGEDTEDILDQMESEREASLVNYRPPQEEATGEIFLSEEDQEEIRASANEDSMGVKDQDEDSGLSFSMPQDEEEETLTDGALEFSVGDEDESSDLTATTDDLSFDTGEDEIETLDQSDDLGGLELSEDSDDGLDLGEDDSEDLSSFDADDEGGLELGSSEDEGGLDLSSADDEFGDLDLGEEDNEIEPTVVMSSKQRMEEFPSGGLDMDEDSTLDLTSEEFDDDPIFDESIPDPSIKSGNTGSLEGTIKSIIAHPKEDDIGELTGDYSLPEGTDLTSSEEIGLSELMDSDETQSFEESPEEDETIFDTMQVPDDETIGETTDPTRIFSEKVEDDIEETLYAHKEETKASGSRVARAPIAERSFNEEDSIRSQGLLRAMREEREALLKQMNELKANMKLLESENLGLKAEKEELKIEIAIIKKRNQNEVEELNYRLKIAEEKRDIYKEKVKSVQVEFDRASQRVRIDHTQIKQREKELEGQLELVRADSQSQVESRDKKIIELKRKIDALEFNMENTVIREQKTRDDKLKLEERLGRMMKTLRGSIQVLENDLLEDDIAVSENDEGKDQFFKK
jgi:CheY-like chemotaxis protein